MLVQEPEEEVHPIFDNIRTDNTKPLVKKKKSASLKGMFEMIYQAEFMDNPDF